MKSSIEVYKDRTEIIHQDIETRVRRRKWA